MFAPNLIFLAGEILVVLKVVCSARRDFPWRRNLGLEICMVASGAAACGLLCWLQCLHKPSLEWPGVIARNSVCTSLR